MEYLICELDEEPGPHSRVFSAGEEARIRLARAFVTNPDVCLLDEPFNGLDAATKTATLRLTERALRGKTCVLVTHNSEELSLVDTVYQIRDGELYRSPHAANGDGLFHFPAPVGPRRRSPESSERTRGAKTEGRLNFFRPPCAFGRRLVSLKRGGPQSTFPGGGASAKRSRTAALLNASQSYPRSEGCRPSAPKRLLSMSWNLGVVIARGPDEPTRSEFTASDQTCWASRVVGSSVAIAICGRPPVSL